MKFISCPGHIFLRIGGICLDFKTLIQYIISGLAIGSIYALVAVGYAMIWKAMGVLNFSQGQIFMLGGFFGLTALRLMGTPQVGTVPVILGVAVFVSGLAIALAIFTQTLVFAPIQKRTPPERLKVNMLVSTMAVGIILENAARLIWGSEPNFFPRIFGTRVFMFADIFVPEHYIRIISLAVILVVLLQLLMFRTKMGRAMRAIAQDRDTAALMGVNVKQGIYLTLCVTYVLGALAGMLVAPLLYVSFDYGGLFGLKGFTAAVIGGIGTIPGAILGGLSLGVIENVGAGVIDSTYKNAIAFLVLILVLLIKPSGLLGKRTVQKV
jgi:branched-chain amino acid transport system permease protein